MSAIVTPIPEPLPAPDVPELSAEPGRSRYFRPVAAAVVLGLLALATIFAWERAASDPSPSSATDPLAASLQWMFDATLTYPGTSRDGVPSPPPFDEFSVQSVTIIDPASGPILVVGRATKPDGTVDDVTYRIVVIRTGDGWAIEAGRLTAAERLSRGES